MLQLLSQKAGLEPNQGPWAGCFHSFVISLSGLFKL